MHPTNINYLGHQAASSDFTPAPSRGGTVLQLAAGATLNVGDAVQLSAEDTVIKATTNPTKVIGIVVGGAQLPNYIFETGGADIATLITAGVQAAISGDYVLVQIIGIAYVVADGVIANGALVKQSGTTAGKVTTATASTDAGQILGKLVGAASAADGDVRKLLVALM